MDDEEYLWESIMGMEKESPHILHPVAIPGLEASTYLQTKRAFKV